MDENVKDNKIVDFPVKENINSKSEQKNEEKDKTPEQIKLAEVVNVVSRFVQGKSSVEELDELGNRMTIRNYIPILDKMRLIMAIIFKFNAEDVEMHEIRVINMERELFFDVLLGGYAMIDVNDPDLRTYQSYDLLYPAFANFILQYCKDDYDKIVKMIEDSLNIYAMKDLDSLFNNVDYKTLKESAKQHEELLKSFEKNKKLVADLRKIYEAENPDGVKVLDAVSETIQREANEEAKQKISNTTATKKSKSKKN
ncbi:MAG: hypothetical protein DBY43_06885 [Clostridiaceae bacterium]|nr:MAG: hypothetical protein DBY43_06885 [Clostridiaceae bacterium]